MQCQKKMRSSGDPRRSECEEGEEGVGIRRVKANAGTLDPHMFFTSRALERKVLYLCITKRRTLIHRQMDQIWVLEGAS